MSEYKLLIDGALVSGAHEFDVVNPATEQPFAKCPCGSKEQLDAAIKAAKTAFSSWAARPLDERRDLILKLADAIEANTAPLSRLLVREQGKPLAEAETEIAYTAVFLREMVKHEMAAEVLEDTDQRRIELHRRPLGVVGLILPWNFPILLIAFKLPYALLAGNTVIIKPAPTTPLSTLKLGELIADIFPQGVINIVADNNNLGDHLSSHPDIAKISFTGSTNTGKKVMSCAAGSLKRLTLELGGNDPAIILGDVDPAKVANAIFGHAFSNAGQICLAIKRVYAHDRIYDALCSELGKLADEAVVDDGLKQGTRIGPVQNKAQYQKVLEFIEDGRKNGKIVAGGGAEDRPGYFIKPTIVRDITDGTRLVDEEQFGPVLPIIRFSDAEDALARANASPWGLGASVWSNDLDTARSLAQRINSGTVWINTHIDFGPTIPFGGAKQSGFGVEFAEDGFHEFTQLHVINESKQAPG